ncbi:hypothetical protein FQA39_LY10863 [Lamprigera yunnana]|nr:hypothetical protein FQA39_LY10863 [Lamprigera yunnana]
MELHLTKSYPIKSEVIIEETFPFCDHSNEEVKSEVADVKEESYEEPFECNEGDNLVGNVEESWLYKLVTKDYGYSCDICNFKAIERNSLLLHSKMHKNNYVCKECSFKTNWKNTFKKHLKNHLKISENHKEPQWKYCLPSHTIPTVLKYFCSKCDFKTWHRNFLRVHMKTHESNEYYFCGECDFKTLKNVALLAHLKIHTGRQYVCNKCSFKTIWKKCLQRHSIIHEKACEYHCKECNFKTRWEGSLKRHSEIHEEHRPYTCDECNKSFKHKTNLKQHIYNVHHLKKQRKEMLKDKF